MFLINQLLTQWYADPLSREEAKAMALMAQKRMEKYHQNGSLAFLGIMQQMVADWWLHDCQSIFPSRGMHYANSKRKLALYQLIAGQLLLSCRLDSAMDYLDMGLRHADGLITSKCYFELYNRHEELRFLKLASVPQKPRSLSELLNESRVMRKLSPNSRYSIPK